MYKQLLSLLRPRRSAARKTHYSLHKDAARTIIHERLAYFSPLCGVVVKRVAIRNQKRRWGSCSSLGNLNFNYKVLFLPPCLRDYIIVHELCHLKELNHGPAFWREVASYYPSFKEAEGSLRRLERETCMLPHAIIRYRQSYLCSCCQIDKELAGSSVIQPSVIMQKS